MGHSTDTEGAGKSLTSVVDLFQSRRSGPVLSLFMVVAWSFRVDFYSTMALVPQVPVSGPVAC